MVSRNSRLIWNALVIMAWVGVLVGLMSIKANGQEVEPIEVYTVDQVDDIAAVTAAETAAQYEPRIKALELAIAELIAQHDVSEPAVPPVVVDPPAPGPLTLNFPETYEHGEDLVLQATGQAAEGEDAVIQAWHVEQRRVIVFATIDSAPWVVPANIMTSLPPGTVELQILRRKNFKFVDRVTKLVTVPGEDDAAPGPPPDANTIEVTNAKQFNEALSDAKAGDVIEVTASFRISQSVKKPPLNLTIRGVGMPLIECPLSFAVLRDGDDGLTLDGLWLKSYGREASHKTFNGVDVYGAVDGLTIRNCKVDGFAFNVIFQTIEDSRRPTNITVEDSGIINSWSTSHHSSGIFAKGVDGLMIRRNVVAFNGYNKELGVKATRFNHGGYIQKGVVDLIDGKVTGTRACTHVSVIDNLFVENASHGVQLRSGGIIEGNVFRLHPYAAFSPGKDATGFGGWISRNVVIGGGNIPDDGVQGMGFEAHYFQAIGPVLIEDNLVWDKNPGSAKWMPAFHVNGERDGPGRAEAWLRGNVAGKWPVLKTSDGGRVLEDDTREITELPGIGEAVAKIEAVLVGGPLDVADIRDPLLISAGIK